MTSEREIIDLKKCQLIRLDENKVILRFKDQIEFDLKDAVEVQDILVSMFAGKFYLMLVDTRDVFGSISHEARQFFAKDSRVTTMRRAEALVVNNTANYIIAKFYAQFHQPSNPVQVFKDFDKASEWLEKFRI